jgi:hypothetical protein
MKKLITSGATGTVRQPVLPRTLQHVQEAYTEAIDAVVRNLTSYSNGTLRVLFGCVVTPPSGGVASVTAGAVFYNGEVYLVDARTNFACTGGNIPVWNIVTTYQTGDPVALVDYVGGGTTNANVHEIKKFILGAAASGSGLFDYNSASVIYAPRATVGQEVADDTMYTLNASTMQLIPGMTYTTPNDGVTRKLQFLFKAHGIIDPADAVDDPQGDWQLYDVTNNVQLDRTTMQLNIHTSVVWEGSMTICLTKLLSVAPNTTIEVRGASIQHTVKSKFNKFIITEIR